MKIIIFLLITMTTIMPAFIFSQTIGHIPEKLSSVSDNDYELAVRILEETYANVVRDNNNFVYADYWNLAYAYALAHQDVETITEFLLKSQQLDPETFYTVFHSSEATTKRWKEMLSPDVFEQLSAPNQKTTDGSMSANATAEVTKEEKYTALQCKLISIRNADQQYRSSSNGVTEEQRKLDLINQREIMLLYEEYNSYLGVELVGKELSVVMWAVIQHSNLEMMKKFLPVIHQATKDRQLPGEGPLKLLIDRIYSLENGHQIFGSQVGVPLADSMTVKKIMEQYGFRRISTMKAKPPNRVMGLH